MKKALDSLKQHVVDCTAGLSVTVPIFANLETKLLEVDPHTSLHMRLAGAGLSYLGMGSLYSRGRDYVRNKFLDENSSEITKRGCDMVYNALFNIAICPVYYYAIGLRDKNKIFSSTALAVGMGVIIGIPVGYMIDTYRDFTGIKNSDSLPCWLRNMNSKTKIFIAGALTALSLGTTILNYEITPNKITQVSIEQK